MIQTVISFAATAQPSVGAGPQLLSLLIFPLMLVVMYFLLIRPQRKQEKKLQEQRKQLVVGDQIVTNGGLMGKVVNIKDNEITLQTSVAKTLITVRRDAIYKVERKESAE